MYLTNDLFSEVFEKPYKDLGFRKLFVLSGYASPAFLHHVLNKYPDIQIRLIIGMAKKDGIPRWSNNEYKRLTKDTNRVKIYYYNGKPAIHSKLYHWFEKNSLGNNSITFVGSSNFSWNGFRDQGELMVQADYNNIYNIIKTSFSSIIECVSPLVEDGIKLHDFITKPKVIGNDQIKIDFVQEKSVQIGTNIEELQYIDLPLYIKGNKIHEKSGLNWGQRPGREPNQAYIPVSTQVHKNSPDFFPELKEEFIIITDDGEEIICVMAQQNRKAIHSSRNNSILGIYFRNRIGVSLGNKVDIEDLQNYGRDFVRIYKLDTETYYMDFSV
jgi:hypothetical protein